MAAARSIGTHQVRELIVRRKEGPLLTSLATGDASSRLVEAYRLRPNAIKALARCGQGYSLSDEGLRPGGVRGAPLAVCGLPGCPD